MSTDISDWRITFVDTGLAAEIGERLRRVRRHLADDEYFLAHYGDVLTDAPMNEIVSRFQESTAVASLLAIPPPGSFHVVHYDQESSLVSGFQSATDLPVRVNGGFFVLRQSIFDYLEEGEDLVSQGFAKAARDGRILAIPYDGFWQPMDTLKERAQLEQLYLSGASPWTVWREGGEPETSAPVALVLS